MVLVVPSPNDHAKVVKLDELLVKLVVDGKQSLVAIKLGVERMLNTTTFVIESLNPPGNEILNLTL